VVPKSIEFKTSQPVHLHRLCTRQYADEKEPYISAKEPFISAKEPYISAKEPYESATEPYISAKEPYISSQPVHLHWLCTLKYQNVGLSWRQCRALLERM